MDIKEKLEMEGLTPASFSKRVSAYSIDELIVSIIIFIAFFSQFQSLGDDIIAIVNFVNSIFIYLFLLKTAYHTIFIYLYGKTIGKMALKIRAVDIDILDNPSLKQSFIRAIVRNFDEIFFCLGMLFALTNPLIQTIHDKVSKVVVIDD
jgi:uncharacterized RDD family membrane protein YckC